MPRGTPVPDKWVRTGDLLCPKSYPLSHDRSSKCVISIWGIRTEGLSNKSLYGLIHSSLDFGLSSLLVVILLFRDIPCSRQTERWRYIRESRHPIFFSFFFPPRVPSGFAILGVYRNVSFWREHGISRKRSKKSQKSRLHPLLTQA